MASQFVLKSLATLAVALSLVPAAGTAQAADVPAEVRFAYAGGPRVWILGKIDKSFDKAFGTNVKWIPFASGSDVLSLFAAKEIDIARFGGSPTVAELLAAGYRQIALWEHVVTSMARAFAAFMVAIVTGVPLGLIMGRSAGVSALLESFVQFLRPLPKIALIPLAVVWFGIGEGSKFFLIFISCFLSVVVSAAAAVNGISQSRIRAAQTLGASQAQVFLRVVLPNALPEIFTGVRLSIGICWTSLIAAEMVAATSGLGWMVVNAGSYMRTDVVVLGILLLGIIGYLFDAALVALQRAFVPWAGREA